MGCKIPAKKHRGVKDPAQQQAKRLQSLKGKINAPPKDPDEQPVPRSLTQLFAFREPKTENVKKKKHKHIEHAHKDQSKLHGGKNPVSQMKRLPGESGRSFSLRINNAVKALHGVVEDDNYPLDMEEDSDVQGERMAAQRRRRERKRRSAKPAADAPDAPPSRAQRLALKKQAKKQKLIEAKQERCEVVYERVGFGEVAHAPPTLNFKIKKAGKSVGAPRPGRRDLLLSKLLAPGAGSPTAAGAGAGPPAGAGAGSGSRARRRARALPPAERLRRERARELAVAAYRALRAQPGTGPKPKRDTASSDT